MNCINLVDTRNFDHIETIRLTEGSFEDRHITGLTFSSDASKLFASLDDVIFEYAIDTLQRRFFCSTTVL
jgi:hypothetical protein